MQRILLLFLLLEALCLSGNNILTTNTALILDAPATGSATVTFDLSWENSWRQAPNGPQGNYDAAWVFVKYRKNGGDWQHAMLSGLSNIPNNATAEIKDGAGAMIYRSAIGTGTVDFSNIELIWDTAPVNLQASDVIDIKVFSIEMVFVPEGPFMLGNNKLSGSDNETRGFSASGNVNGGYSVTDDGPVLVNTGDGNLNASGATTNGGNLPATYPVGFNAFYCMKYEVSQAQWVAFYNLLTEQQKTARDITGATGKDSDQVVFRNGLSYTPGSPATTSLPTVAMNFTSRNDCLAYLDWAALRPMTETEFEKASKGPEIPSPGWYAWGNNSIKQGARYQVTGSGLETEQITAGTFDGTDGNAVYGGETDNPNVIGSTTASQGPTSINGQPGPFRCGIFAGSTATPNRVQSGASYYGIMELSGNVAEGMITIGTTEAQNYTGNHGDGQLTTDGDQDEGWPTGLSISWRGGWFSGDVTYMMIADRSLVGSNPNVDTTNNHATSNDPNARLNYYQMRGLRD